MILVATCKPQAGTGRPGRVTSSGEADRLARSSASLIAAFFWSSAARRFCFRRLTACPYAGRCSFGNVPSALSAALTSPLSPKYFVLQARRVASSAQAANSSSARFSSAARSAVASAIDGPRSVAAATATAATTTATSAPAAAAATASGAAAGTPASATYSAGVELLHPVVHHAVGRPAQDGDAEERDREAGIGRCRIASQRTETLVPLRQVREDRVRLPRPLDRPAQDDRGHDEGSDDRHDQEADRLVVGDPQGHPRKAE